MEEKVKIAPSILSADFARLGEQVAEVTRAGADYIHVDVMDGHFVPNISIGASVVASIRPWTTLPLDVHLMIEFPDCYIGDFASSGANIITVHIETCPHIHRTLSSIRDKGIRAGVSLNPATPLSSIEEVIPYVDLVLVMSVNPGFGGQDFIPEVFSKITRLRELLNHRGSSAEIEVDGGINESNAADVVKAGGRVLVAGSSIFNSKTGIAQKLKEIRNIVS
jgi:ribulose-phosphate 3-epimerase